MTRALSASPVALLSFVAALALAAFAIQQGRLADDAVMLWAGAIRAGGGQVPIDRIVASYPTLPFLATTLLEMMVPTGTPSPALLAAGLLALLTGAWFLAFRAAGLGTAFAAAACLLIALHPALLAASLGGAADMFFVAFFYGFANALYGLRARVAATEVMAVGLSLAGMALSHPIGVATAFAVMPCLVFAVPPSLIANSALNLVTVLAFPTVFALAAFSYVSWVFPGSGWSFLASPAASLADWTADANWILRPLSSSPAFDVALAIAVTIIIGAPLIPIALGWARERRPLVTPPLVAAASAVIAGVVTVATGLFGNPALLASTAPVLCATIVARLPVVRDRKRLALVLLAVGWLGGLFALTLIEPRATVEIRAVLDRGGGDHTRADTLALGGATMNLDGILVDADRAPAVVIGRGRANGLIAPGDETFSLTLLLGLINAPFVAVPAPHSPAGLQDRLVQRFPRLYRDGLPGYHLAYENSTWRLYARSRQPEQ